LINDKSIAFDLLEADSIENFEFFDEQIDGPIQSPRDEGDLCGTKASSHGSGRISISILGFLLPSPGSPKTEREQEN